MEKLYFLLVVICNIFVMMLLNKGCVNIFMVRFEKDRFMNIFFIVGDIDEFFYMVLIMRKFLMVVMREENKIEIRRNNKNFLLECSIMCNFCNCRV